MKRIALLDPFRGGHHASYLKLYAEVALSLGFEIMLFCPDPQETQNLLVSDLKRYEHRIKFFPLDEPGESSFPVRLLRPALRGFGLWLAAARAVKKAHREAGVLPDLVFFLWLDSYATHLQSRYLIDSIFPYDWSGLLFHPYQLRLPLRFPALRRGPLDLCETLKARHCRALGVLDEGVAAGLQLKLPDRAVIVFPDLGDQSAPDADYPLLKTIVAKARGRKIISLLGSLEKRKGVLALLEVAQSGAAEDCFFVFAGAIGEGSFAADERAHIARVADSRPDNCLFHFQFIPGESQFNALVAVSDVLFAAYDNFLHSSNILLKAALFRKPVIVSSGHCMAERVNSYRLGMTIEYGNSEQCLDAIRELSRPRCQVLEDEEADYDGYQAMHSRRRLAESLQKTVDYYF